MTEIRVDGSEVIQFGHQIEAVRWEQPLQGAYDESGEKIAQKARSNAGSVGGAAGLTAATLTVETAFDRAEVTAAAPFARGSEFGSGGGNPNTRQFSNRPGPNRSDGYWLGPALDESEGEILRRFGEAVDEAVRPAFGF